jgi:hypothetical protein
MEPSSRIGDNLPQSAHQIWQDFVKRIIDERDPDRVSDLFAKLNQELAEIDHQGAEPVIAELHTISS